MNITIKEIAIGSSILLGSSLLIACVASSSTKDKKTKNVEASKKSPLTVIKNEPASEIQKKEVVPTIKEEVKKESTPENKQEHVEDQKKLIELETLVLEFTDDDFPLRLGSKGQRVIALQKYLLRNHGSAGIVTDQYDQKMHQRVRKYLKVDKVDKALFNRLIYPKKRRR